MFLRYVLRIELKKDLLNLINVYMSELHIITSDNKQKCKGKVFFGNK